MNSALNSVIDERCAAALKEEAEVDARLSWLLEEERADHFKQKPSLGIPFTTKNWFSVRGLSWSSGLLARKDVKVGGGGG